MITMNSYESLDIPGTNNYISVIHEISVSSYYRFDELHSISFGNLVRHLLPASCSNTFDIDYTQLIVRINHL